MNTQKYPAPPEENKTTPRSTNSNSSEHIHNPILSITIPFDLNRVTDPAYPIEGWDILEASGEDKFQDLSDWLERHIKELGIKDYDYVHTKETCNNEETYQLSPCAALRIAATFENKFGADAREYINYTLTHSSNDKAPVLPELTVCLQKLYKAKEDSLQWYQMGEKYAGYVTPPENYESFAGPDDLAGQNLILDSAFAKDVTDLAWEKMTMFDAFERVEVRKISAQMEAIYESPIYTDAATLGLAPSLTSKSTQGNL